MPEPRENEEEEDPIKAALGYLYSLRWLVVGAILLIIADAIMRL